MRSVLALFTVALVAAGGHPAAAQRPELAARAAAYVKALSSGSPEQFEAMAKDNFTPDLLAHPADERRQMVERIRSDFGVLSVAAEEATSPTHVDLTMKSATNPMPMVIGIEFEAAPPYRIARVGIRVGGPAGGRGGRGGPPPLPAPPIDGRMSAGALASALDGYLSGLARSGDFAGVVIVAKDGQPVFQKAYGIADRERQTPMAADLRFNLASIGKAFTKTAIGQLIAAGKLKPADSIGALIPDYPNPEAKSATVDQLLNMRGGIADFFGDAFAAAPKDRFQSNHDYYAFVAPQPLTFAPGTRTQYCNGCYAVLGEIVARVSGAPYERYIEEHVFTPAGMKTAGFLAYGDANVAPPYTRPSPDAPWAPAIGMHGRHGSAAGGAFASAADLLAFDNAVRTRVLLDANTTAWFFENPADATRARAMDPYGIAGGAPGANSSLESNGAWTVVTLGNLDPPNAVRVGETLAAALYGR